MTPPSLNLARPVMDVACAAIFRGGRLLLAQRQDNGLWELPGGKRRPSETMRQCLRREIIEELACRLTPLALLGLLRQRRAPGPDLALWAFGCRLIGPHEPRALEHLALRWVRPAEADGLALCPADRLLLGLWRPPRGPISRNCLRRLDKSPGKW
ncbi:NUDIX hydrolase [Desulfarculus baarsii DSM 2075]|uniref:NUDIX hydrolase n=1 Tax=Desulfarculus baarsii (strain ATCC 33931 / DSM 2075 / LMG 7858 / VKM B-1802 / 2st14) TaxID=644282 RepID=E1QHQ5_DESB2|nr:NUDIX domain-containing protein [Desulfarculus baarsii]ADK85098.1 NUDIX hydrolase [Desulfarculus baarsii DSM 2075]